MLSGSLSGWAGWAVSGPLVWAGWLVAGALCAGGPGRRQATGVVVLALSSAFALYGGFPETLVLMAIALGALVLIGGAVAGAAPPAAPGRRRPCRGRPRRRGGPVRPSVAPGPGRAAPVLPLQRERHRWGGPARSGPVVRPGLRRPADGRQHLDRPRQLLRGDGLCGDRRPRPRPVRRARRLAPAHGGGVGRHERPVPGDHLRRPYATPVHRSWAAATSPPSACSRCWPFASPCWPAWAPRPCAGAGTSAGTQRRLLASLVACGGVLVYLLAISRRHRA